MKNYTKYCFLLFWIVGALFLSLGTGTQVSIVFKGHDSLEFQESLKIYYQYQGDSAFSEKNTYSKIYRESLTNPDTVSFKTVLPVNVKLLRVDFERIKNSLILRDVDFFVFGYQVSPKLISKHSVSESDEGEYIVGIDDPQLVFDTAAFLKPKIIQITVCLILWSLFCYFLYCARFNSKEDIFDSFTQFFPCNSSFPG